MVPIFILNGLIFSTHDKKKKKEQSRGGKTVFQMKTYSSFSIMVSYDAAEVFREKSCLPPIQVV